LQKTKKIYIIAEKTTIQRNINKLKNEMAEYIDSSFKKIEIDDFEELFTIYKIERFEKK